MVLKKQTMGGLLEKLFPASDEISRVSLENKFYQLANSHDADGVLDIARMVVVHLLCSFLLERRSQWIEDALWPIILNLNAIKDYNWAEAVYRFLVASMNEVAPKVQSHRVGCRSTTWFLNDAAIVLQVKLIY